MKNFLMQRAQSDWFLVIVLSTVTAVILVTGMLGLSFVFAWASPPKPIAAGSFHRWRNSEIITIFHNAGLTADVIRGATKDERDGFSGGMRVEATLFQLSPRQEERGMILVFENAADLGTMRAYYLGLNKSLPQYRSWLFVKDNVLLQINGEVPEERAKEYAAQLDSLGGW